MLQLQEMVPRCPKNFLKTADLKYFTDLRIIIKAHIEDTVVIATE